VCRNIFAGKKEPNVEESLVQDKGASYS